MKSIFWIILLFFTVNCLFAQRIDSSKTTSLSVSDSLLNSHSPMKASIMSAILPGLGQAYNRKYWKIPIIYAGLGMGVYFLSSNIVQYNTLKTAYIEQIKIDKNYSNAQELAAIETTRRYAELSVIGIAAFYVLNIVDASVDAHLFYFDVSDDLTINFQPFITPLHNSNDTFAGGKLVFTF